MDCKYCLSTNITSSHFGACGAYKKHNYTIESKLTKELLYDLYYVKQLSIAQIAKQFEISNRRILHRAFDKFQIPLRTSKERAQNPLREQQIKATCLERYGVNHHLKAESIIAKRTETVQDVYGVSNVFKSEKIKSQIKATCLKRYGAEFPSKLPMFKDAFKQVCIERYGVDNPSKSPVIISKIMKTKITNNTLTPYFSKVSQRLFWKIYHRLPSFLKEHTYFAELNKEFGKWIDDKYMCYDFVISSISYCLEFNGTYYHADPTVYSPDWINKKLGMTATEIWDKDSIKNNALRSTGFIVDVIWQREDENTAINRALTSINRQIQSNALCLPDLCEK